MTPEGCFPYSEKTYLLSTEPFRLRYQTQDLESIFHPLMAHLEIADRITRWDYELRAGGREYVLLRNRKEMHRDTLIGLIQGRLVMEVLQISYPNKEWLAVAHAGAVSDHRRAVVMPARSGSGKSTLTAALVHSGLSYFGDDIIPLTRKGPLAVSFPTRIGLKEGSWPVLAAYYPS
ncbi:MAG: hypothetical protein LJE70_18035 [Chromatiaceae bacterium]|nr:hypothetical protein [Chromatiaceae bacterium]